MKFAVDGYELGAGARGVGRTVHNLLDHLIELFPQDSFIVWTKEEIGRYRRSGVEERVLPARGRGYIRWLNGPLRRALLAERPDVFLAANYLLPLFYSGRSVVFEHDISPVAHPEWYSRKYALSRGLLVRRSVARARAVIVPSEFTRQEILSFFVVSPEKVRRVWYGVGEEFRRAPSDQVKSWKEKKGLAGKKVVGFLGSIFRRRHIPALVRVTGRLRSEFPDLVLYIVGRNLGGLTSAEADGIQAADWIKWDSELAEGELPLFYSSLDAFAYLSEYEGFGLPPLEALACGTPAVVLNLTSLGEVLDGLALMAESVDEEEIARVLGQALTDESVRTKLLANFESRRQLFSWNRAAREVATVLDRVVSGGGRP
jgi:glycosyltransferase involved in cell wall biosynthesis